MDGNAHEKPDTGQLKQRCPRLGHDINFNYCLMSDDNDLPCWKVFDCWWEIFDVDDWLKTHLSAGQYRQLTRKKPKHKVTSILEIIENAKKRTGKDKPE